jgi:hypothetical protein
MRESANESAKWANFFGVQNQWFANFMEEKAPGIGKTAAAKGLRIRSSRLNGSPVAGYRSGSRLGSLVP